MQSRISKVELFSYDLTYVGGEYVMSGGRVIKSLSSTVVRVTTASSILGVVEDLERAA